MVLLNVKRFNIIDNIIQGGNYAMGRYKDTITLYLMTVIQIAANIS